MELDFSQIREKSKIKKTAFLQCVGFFLQYVSLPREKFRLLTLVVDSVADFYSHNKMKLLGRILLVAAFIAPFLISCAGGLRLSENSRAAAQIVLPDTPTPVEKTAASELKEHLDKVCGADFKIVALSESDKSAASIFVGDSPASRRMLACDDFGKLPYDSVRMKSDGRNIALCGHPQRGSLYAVYTFLEDYVGVRWWSKSERFLPSKSMLEISDFDITYSPVLKHREALYKVAFDGVFAARMKQNGSTLTRMNFDRPVISPEYGGCEHLVLFKGRGSSFHAHYEILPPDKYFAKHPEWYSLIKGKRSSNHAQLCLTNEEMAREYLKNVKELLRADPLATSIQVSQNDWHNACECPKCKAIDDENGSQAGTNIYFANKIAEGIEKEFPNVYVDTFAYQYTRKAPSKIVPRKNVLVRLCTIECSFLTPLEKGAEKQNADFVRDMKEWAKITNNLFIWDYVTNFRSYMSPYPNMGVLAPNIRFFAENSASGVFEQGDAFCSAGDFVLMRNWVISHLMWNPQADEKALFDEFLYGYYGREVGSIFKKYLNVIHDRALESKVYLGCFLEDATLWLDPATYNRAAAILDDATATAARLEAENPEKYRGLSQKVARERLSFDHMSIVHYYDLKRMAKRQGVKIDLPPDPKAALEKIGKTWDELKVETWREFTTPEDFKSYRRNLADSVDSQAAIFGALESMKKSASGPFPLYPDAIKKYSWKTYQSFMADVFEDKNAETGFASKVPLASNFEKIQMPLSEKFFSFGDDGRAVYRFSVSIRADAENFDKKRQACDVVIFNSKWKAVAAKKIPLGEAVSSEYKLYEIGDAKFSREDLPLYLAIRRNADDSVKGVYVGKIDAQRK